MSFATDKVGDDSSLNRQYIEIVNLQILALVIFDKSLLTLK